MIIGHHFFLIAETSLKEINFILIFEALMALGVVKWTYVLTRRYPRLTTSLVEDLKKRIITLVSLIQVLPDIDFIFGGVCQVRATEFSIFKLLRLTERIRFLIKQR